MNRMVKNTIEGFIRKLKEEGHPKYASELRYILAMSRQRKEALSFFHSIIDTLLAHLIKFIALPQSRNKNKWIGEIKGYLSRLNLRNKNPKGLPWLSLEYINNELNSILSHPDFYSYMEKEALKEYSDYEKNKTLSLLNVNKTLKKLSIKFSYDSDYRLNVGVKSKIL